MIAIVWFMGTAFAALGGVLIGINTQLKPDIGVGLASGTLGSEIEIAGEVVGGRQRLQPPDLAACLSTGLRPLKRLPHPCR